MSDTHAIDEAVLDVLRDAVCTGNTVTLSGQLDRSLYTATDKVLRLLGGVWSRSRKAHIFPDDPEQALSLAIMTGKVLDYKKIFQIFETPAGVADTLVALAGIKPEHRVLEPSAGRGALIRAIERSGASPVISVCELNEGCAAVLECEFGLTLLERDFLSLTSDHKFDRIVMNPPFRHGQDITHVHKAVEDHLNPGGRVVALTYPGWEYRKEAKYAAFRDWMKRRPHTVTEVPAGAFSESGTDIRTLMLTIDKP